MTHALPSTDRSLPIALLRARERVMGPIRHLLSDVDLTEQQWRVLRVVQESGPIDPTQIADRACLLLPSLTRILQKLEEKGLINRVRDEADRRRQVITLTAAGDTVIEENIDASLELIERTREKMGPDRYEALLDLLNDLYELDD
ncbi:MULTISPECIES: homoprotocatechuate degradation operon regulator HpaR [Tritonibacter]|uniref:Homoprotocatechuate degradation operon regulator HpaR n=1 Tax=Tritonibacter scottomollicae TaxID=483013 RepID=A0A2T1ADJ3_TRISK|nr:homoprotocatechuate degradation operon regulator HpaR [Tritonibacter scottomollicae]PRZ46597.1 MarR family transcriptional regulator [Tritonibacter scottomollicae]WOI32746.1 homoprotocatechuate degradation operon regulator HpaR [Tritonibacter scottomollicae]